MAILADRNAGFSGDVHTEEWANMLGMGARMAVLPYTRLDSPVDSFKASRGTGDRVIKVTPGRAFGHGVLSTFTTETNDTQLAGEPVTAGSRWDTLVIRRNWIANTAQLVLLKGSSSPTVPAFGSTSSNLRTDWGATIADQPLWLIRFDANSSVAQQFVDLRTFVGHGGGLLAREEHVLQFLTEVGTHVTLAGGANGEGKSWYRAVNAQGVAVWQQATPTYHQHHIADIAGISNPVTGNAAGLQVRAASWAGLSSSSGGMTLNFPTPFPTACLAVVVTNGAGDSLSFWPEVVTKDRSSFSYRIKDAAGDRIPLKQHRVDYIAIGV